MSTVIRLGSSSRLGFVTVAIWIVGTVMAGIRERAFMSEKSIDSIVQNYGFVFCLDSGFIIIKQEYTMIIKIYLYSIIEPYCITSKTQSLHRA